MKQLLRIIFLGAGLLAGAALPAAERIPPAPPRHFNDFAGVVSAGTASRLDAQLAQFERDSSNQLLVVIYPKMESDSSVQDYTVRVAESWRVGQSGKNNGAVLFAFMASRDLYLQVGYGLEGAIPDAIAKRIIEREIVPRFRQRDFDGGMTAAVNAMIAAAKGEYQGTGRTVAETRRRSGDPVATTIVGVVVGLALLFALVGNAIRKQGRRYPTVLLNPRRVAGLPRVPWWMSGGNTGGRGIRLGGGSSWSGGGGGFSGGGGSFGGGGAGGRW